MIEQAERRSSRLAPLVDRIPPGLVLWLAAFSLTAIFVVFAYVLYAARLDERQHVWTASQNLATVLARQIGREIELLDLSLLSLADSAAEPRLMALPERLRQLALFDRVGVANGLGALLLLDASGHVVEEAGVEAPPPVDLSREPFFDVHRSSTDSGLFVSRPFVSLIDGEMSLALSRRVMRGGVFAGVAVATIRLSHIGDVFAALDLGPADTLMLAQGDGTMIMRRPAVSFDTRLAWEHTPRERQAGAGETGTFEAVSPLDGVRRQYFFSKLGESGLTQFVGRASADIYAAWWRRTLVTAGAVLVLGNAILGLVLLLQVELRRRRVAEAALAVLATTDPLTGLANRREFDARLAGEWVQAGAGRRPLALLLLDIDHFKALNDHAGHLIGDAALEAIGGCLGALAGRPGGLVARYGGEEFALLLPNTDMAYALRHAERVRLAVRRLAVPHPTSPVGHLTVSIGIAVETPADDRTAASLVREADLALYEAKRSGRDRAVAATALVRAA